MSASDRRRFLGKLATSAASISTLGTATAHAAQGSNDDIHDLSRTSSPLSRWRMARTLSAGATGHEDGAEGRLPSRMGRLHRRNQGTASPRSC